MLVGLCAMRNHRLFLAVIKLPEDKRKIGKKCTLAGARMATQQMCTDTTE